jgi:acetyl-CoA C-acetyltransferase
MREVAIVGVGQTPVREHWDRGLRELATEAILNAMDDAGVTKVEMLFVGNMLSGYLSHQENLGALIVEYAGLEETDTVKIEAACASGAAAFRQAVLAVASGTVNTAIALGVEKLTEKCGFVTSDGLATASDADNEAAMGLSFVAINALLMQRYMYEYNYLKSDFSGIVVNAHKNASHNPNAIFQKPITEKQYKKSKIIAEPINLLDSSPIADGAAAVVVCAIDNLSMFESKPVLINACEVGNDTIALDNRANPLKLRGVEKSTVKAFQTAGIQHKDIDLFEFHDAFSIITVLSLEASGLADWGTGLKLVQNGSINIGGRIPISTFGGLKGRGHPVGATGLYQIVEAAIQLRGEAPVAIQVPAARYALAQNIGGSGSNVFTTILERKA